MPEYKTPRHGVSLSEAQHEAAAIAPITRAMVSTFELFHPLGTPEGAIYVVNDYAALLATKEAGATRDAGLQVDFLACSVKDSRPEESDSTPNPEISLQVDGVSGVMAQALRAARGSLVPWELTERVYAADDTSGPATLPPLTVYLSGADVDGESIVLQASFGDSANVSVPRIHFNRREHPGLVR